MTSSQNLSVPCQNTYFSTQLAIELKSTELAIILQFFINVITNHIRMGRNSIDGRTWNFCSQAQLVEYFPFWTEKMIRTRLEKLVKMGILITANHNKLKYDRTLWYAFKDQSKWGLDKIQTICPIGKMEDSDQENGQTQMGGPIPSTTTPTTPFVYQVNDDISLTPQKNKKKSLFKGKVKFSEDQLAAFDFLKSLNLDTSDDTLSWWARTYTLSRLSEVYKEAVKRKPDSLGAYMQKLLKKGAVVIAGRIEINSEFAIFYKELKKWSLFEIRQKYAIAKIDGKEIEIDFNMDPDLFRKYLEQKYTSLELKS